MQQLAEKVVKQAVSSLEVCVSSVNVTVPPKKTKNPNYSSNILGNRHLTAPKPNFKHILIILRTALGGR